jgi:hypothetical protein
MSEEARAIEYRRKMQARTRNKAARERALAGSRSARMTNLSNWQPMIDWLAERNNNDGGSDSEEYGQIFNLNPGVE